MRIVVTGAAGMLGQALAPVLAAEHQVIGLTRRDCDLGDEAAVSGIYYDLLSAEMAAEVMASAL